MTNSISPKVSAVIPTYNRASTIKRCIDSVISQTVNVSEIIVVDDCSTDNTKEILLTIDNIIVLSTENNSGAQSARNIGIKAAKYDWVAFLDSDDEWLPDKIEKQLQALGEVEFDPLTVVHGDCIIRNNDSENIWHLDKLEGNNVYKQLLSASGTFFPAILTSKRALEKIGVLDESIKSYQEWDTAIRLSKFCRFIHIQEPLFYYNLQSDSISSFDKNNIDGYYIIIKKYEKDILSFCGKNTFNRHLIICSNMAANNGNFTNSRKFLSELSGFSIKKLLLLILDYLHIKPKYLLNILRSISWKK